tara:strand:- start:23101 stop:23619 length:519 start_codon:yes stop_codon:yes gene_type:complete
MGHTHYWTTNSQIPQNEWDAFITDAQKILGVLGVPLTGNEDVPQDRTPILHDGMVYFNGVGDDGAETFVLTPNPDDAFCKTYQRPYDEPVMAVLSLAKHHFGSRIHVTSDGHPLEWEDAVRKVRSAFGYGDFPYDEADLRNTFREEYAERYIADLIRLRADMGINQPNSATA